MTPKKHKNPSKNHEKIACFANIIFSCFFALFGASKPQKCCFRLNKTKDSERLHFPSFSGFFIDFWLFFDLFFVTKTHGKKKVKNAFLPEIVRKNTFFKIPFFALWAVPGAPREAFSMVLLNENKDFPLSPNGCATLLFPFFWNFRNPPFSPLAAQVTPKEQKNLKKMTPKSFFFRPSAVGLKISCFFLFFSASDLEKVWFYCSNTTLSEKSTFFCASRREAIFTSFSSLFPPKSLPKSLKKELQKNTSKNT